MIARFLIAVGVATLWTWAAAEEPSRTAPKSPPVTAAVADDVQDLLFLGEKRPLRIRLHLRIDGKPFRQRWEGFMARLFKYADVNDDKVLSKEEMARLPSPAFIKALLDNESLGANSPAPFDQVDTDKDGKVTLEEVMAHFNKSGCGAMQSLPDVSRGGRAAQMTEDLFKRLDRKGDGKLSEESLRAAKETLFALDTNEDELVSAEELIPNFRFGFGGPDPSGKDKPGPALAVVNRDDPPAKQVAPLLARYDTDGNGKLSRAEIGFDEAVFTALDADKDGGLSADELAQWLARPADRELLVPLKDPCIPLDLLDQPRFAPDPEKDLPIEVLRQDAETRLQTGSLERNGETGLLLTSGASFVEFRKERSSQWAFGRRQYEYLQKFHGARHDEPFVTKKAALRNRELGGLFACLDRNGDGKVTEDEFGAFFDLIADVNRGFTVVSLSERGPCLFDLLDTNRDKHLGARELRDAWKTLSRWDADKDGAISKQEVPRLFQVVLCCGRPSRQLAFENEKGPDPAEKGRAGPLWFRKMDVNGDGDISRREWLGSEEDFARIDTDGDGLIDLKEAEKADAEMRKQMEERSKEKSRRE